MTSFLQLPGGLPWWVTLAILVPVALYGLLFLAMPFSVFGVKSRMESIEARLDELHEEIRGLTIRLPEPPPTSQAAAAVRELGLSDAQRPPPVSPTPPPAPEPDLPRFQSGPLTPRRAPTLPQQVRPTRSEPRLDWPR